MTSHLALLTQGPDFVWTLGEKRPDAGWVSVSCDRTGILAARGRRLLSRAPARLPARPPGEAGFAEGLGASKTLLPEPRHRQTPLRAWEGLGGAGKGPEGRLSSSRRWNLM